ncbi:unnamed protein product, partial [Ilex paraguariensis]
SFKINQKEKKENWRKKKSRDRTVWNYARKKLKIFFVVKTGSLPASVAFTYEVKRRPNCCLASSFPTLHFIA